MFLSADFNIYVNSVSVLINWFSSLLWVIFSFFITYHTIFLLDATYCKLNFVGVAYVCIPINILEIFFWDTLSYLEIVWSF